MARWRRRPPAGQTVVHSGRGAQYPSWAFGHRLRAAWSARWAAVGSALDNAMAQSFFGTLQLELLDSRTWTTRVELASAIFEWIEGWYSPRRRHTSVGDLSPVDYERKPATAVDAALPSPTGGILGAWKRVWVPPLASGPHDRAFRPPATVPYRRHLGGQKRMWGRLRPRGGERWQQTQHSR